MSLPLIPEPVALKEAYQRGELTQDEALNLLIYGTDALSWADETRERVRQADVAARWLVRTYPSKPQSRAVQGRESPRSSKSTRAHTRQRHEARTL